MKVRIVSLCLMLWALQCHAFKEGVDYQVLPNASTEEFKQPEVKEVFSFNCPACYLSEPSVKKWKKNLGKNVEFKRVPVAINQAMAKHSKAYYIAKHFKKDDAFVESLFDKIHNKGKSTTKEDELVALLESLGIERQQIEGAFDSISLNIQVEKDKAYVIEQKLFEIPAFIIGDRYKVSPPMTGGDMDKLFAVIEHLLNKIQKP